MSRASTPPTYSAGPGTIFGARPDGVDWQKAPTPFATGVFSRTAAVQPPFRTHTWVSNWFWANGAPSSASPDQRYAVAYAPPASGQKGGWIIQEAYRQGPIYGHPVAYTFNGAALQGNRGLILGTSSVSLLDDGYYSVVVGGKTQPLDTRRLLSLGFSYLDQLWIFPDPTQADAFGGGPAYTPDAALLDDLGDFHARFVVPGPDPDHHYSLTSVQGSPLTWIQDTGDAYHTLQSLSTGPYAFWYDIGSGFDAGTWMKDLGCILVATYVKLTVDSGGRPQGGLNDITSYFPFLVFFDKRTTEFQNGSGGSSLPGLGEARGLLKFNQSGPGITNTYVVMAIPPIPVTDPPSSSSITPDQLASITDLARSVAPFVFNVPTATKITYATFAGSGDTTLPGRVRTTFSVTCDSTANPAPAPPSGTVLCLMPHHYATYPYDGQGKSVLDEASPLQPIAYGSGQLTFQSVRGPLKGHAGSGFTTQYVFNNFLPFMPTPRGLCKGAGDPSVAQTLWDLEAFRSGTYAGSNGPYGTQWLVNPVDTYNAAKQLSALAKEISDVEMLLGSGYQGKGFDPGAMRASLEQGVKDGIELYFQATPKRTKNQDIPYFSLYDAGTSSLFLYPAGGGPNALFPVPPSYLQGKNIDDPKIAPWDGYGTATLINDHFFHYGYLLYSAAQVALRDPAWASTWAPAVDQLAMDIAYDDDEQQPFGWSKIAGLSYPRLRYFDAWQGHGWASGLLFGGTDGNNIESISEEINAWEGLILWGAATGRPRITELGMYLYTTAVYASDTYWFDKLGLLRSTDMPSVSADKANPTAYPAGATYQANTVHAANTSTAAQIWGGKTKCSTFFGTMPAQSTAIVCVPANAGSGLYLGRDPAYLGAWFGAIASFSATLKDSQAQMPVPYGQLDGKCQFTDAQVRSYASFMTRVQGLGGDVAGALQWYTRNVAAPAPCSFNAAAPFIDGADSWAESYIFLQALHDYGLPDWSWVADRPLAAVFSQGDQVTFVALSPGKADTVTFTTLDGSKRHRMSLAAGQMQQETVTM